MSKRLLVFLVMLIFVLSAVSYFAGYLGFEVPWTDKDVKVTVSILTDTETYHSGEFMEARVSTASNKDLDSAIVRIYGIKDRLGRYNINEERIIQIESPGNETVFLIRMPSCYGCAGISPGEYEIISELVYDGKVVGNYSKTITLVK